MNTKAIHAVALALTAWSGIASAALCRDVTVRVDNDFEHDGSPAQIQVVDFDYWDDEEGKWREENWVGNVVVDFGEGSKFITKRNLEYVGGESGVIVRVQYRYMTEKNGWSEQLNAQTAPFTCPKNGGTSKTVTVTPM